MRILNLLPHITLVSLFCWQSYKISDLVQQNRQLENDSKKNLIYIEQLSRAKIQCEEENAEINNCSIGWQKSTPCKITSINKNKLQCEMYPDGNLHVCELTTNTELKNLAYLDNGDYITSEKSKTIRLANGIQASIIKVEDITAQLEQKKAEQLAQAKAKKKAEIAYKKKKELELEHQFQVKELQKSRHPEALSYCQTRNHKYTSNGCGTIKYGGFGIESYTCTGEDSSYHCLYKDSYDNNAPFNRWGFRTYVVWNN